MVLENRNESALYVRARIETLHEALLDTDGAWTRFYCGRDLEEVAERIRRDPSAG